MVRVGGEGKNVATMMTKHVFENIHSSKHNIPEGQLSVPPPLANNITCIYCSSTPGRQYYL